MLPLAQLTELYCSGAGVECRVDQGLPHQLCNIGGTIVNAYTAVLQGRALAGECAEPLTPQTAAREAELFRIALRADSNLELDWLWLYMQLSSPAQRRYSLQRALAINPQSVIARRELALLDPRA